MACPVDEDRSPLAEDFFLVFRTLNMMYQLKSTPDKGVTPRGWFESEVLGRPEDGTRDSGRVPISQDLWGGWKGGSRRRVARGGSSLILLPTTRRSVDSSWRVLKNRPNHVQKVLGTIPVLSDDKEKTRLAASSTPRYPQSPVYYYYHV